MPDNPTDSDAETDTSAAFAEATRAYVNKRIDARLVHHGLLDPDDLDGSGGGDDDSGGGDDGGDGDDTVDAEGWGRGKWGDGPYGDPDEGANGPGPDGDWTITFADDFDQGELDEKWDIGYGWGRTSDGRREYVRDEDVWVDDDNDELVLNIAYDGADGWYSGAVNTQDKHAQQYGYWEAKLKPPEGVSGLLPAFWTKPNDETWPPEIDIVEWMGTRSSSAHHVHYTNDAGEKDDWGHYHGTGTNLSEEFHIYACEWTPDEVIWYLDGKEVARTSDGCSDGEGQLNAGHPFYTMLSCHIWDQPWLGGSPEQLTDYPYEFRADWVRIWERDNDDNDE